MEGIFVGCFPREFDFSSAMKAATSSRENDGGGGGGDKDCQPGQLDQVQASLAWRGRKISNR